MCGSIAQLVEHRTGIAEVTGLNPVEALIFFFFQASSFQLLKLENSLRGSFFTFPLKQLINANFQCLCGFVRLKCFVDFLVTVNCCEVKTTIFLQ